jgi:transketolase
MAAISRANLRVVGTHVGVSIGEDGPSQMGIEDLAMFRALNGTTVLSPCDANQAAALTALMVAQPGISYLRATRGAQRVIYGPDERFTIGGSRIVRASPQDAVTLVATGVTVHEAILAADALAHEGIATRIIDCYSIKPIDGVTLRQAALATGGRLITAEDHRVEGGLGDAVLEVFAEADPSPRVVKLGVRTMPGSGRPQELRDAAGIGARWIAQAARELVLGTRAAKGKAA